jgi:hypothetical protein
MLYAGLGFMRVFAVQVCASDTRNQRGSLSDATGAKGNERRWTSNHDFLSIFFRDDSGDFHGYDPKGPEQCANSKQDLQAEPTPVVECHSPAGTAATVSNRPLPRTLPPATVTPRT